MDWWSATILGIIQGITEWLPISSSGQSTIFLVNGLGIDAETAIGLGLAAHIGTAMAVVVKYPNDLYRMVDPRAGQLQKFYWSTTIISLIFALPLLMLLEATFESNLWTGEMITIFVGLALIATGLILSKGRRGKVKKLSSASFKDYIILGMAQGFAVLPGISRSGMTVSTLLISEYNKTASMRFSFLLSVPVSLAAAAYFTIFGEAASIGTGIFIVVGFFTFIFGYLTMNALLRMAKHLNFSKFCLIFGSLAVFIPIIFWVL